MSFFQVKPLTHPLRGEIIFPADKSITHRAIIISSICQGKTRINNFARNDDCLATIAALRCLGVRIEINQDALLVYGRELNGLNRPQKPIPTRESGSTMRLLLGVLAGQDFTADLTADKSLAKRPMSRVIKPLRMMGVKIKSKAGGYPPITISGGNLKPIAYRLPVASAQVKSAILFAGLYCNATTRIVEPIKTRDHTERMLRLFRADIGIKGNTVSIKGGRELISPCFIGIPGDISSASFFILAATILPESRLIIKSAGINPTRLGAIRVLKRMGADIHIRHNQQIKRYGYEPVGDIIIKSAKLTGTNITAKEIPSLIDEVPILMVAACFAKGTTVFAGVQELRVKETDRVRSMMTNLTKMGADVRVKQKKSKVDLIITGTKRLSAARVSSFGDHRTAMSMVIASLKAKGTTFIDDLSCVNKSFPDFLPFLRRLVRGRN